MASASEASRAISNKDDLYIGIGASVVALSRYANKYRRERTRLYGFISQRLLIFSDHAEVAAIFQVGPG